MIKIPATDAGIPAIEQMTTEGYGINMTLIFSLTRYRRVIDAYTARLLGIGRTSAYEAPWSDQIPSLLPQA